MEAEQANDSDELYDQQTESEKPADSDESYDQLGESEQADQQLYAQLGESEQADQQLYAQLGESEQRADSDQLYDQLAEPEPVSQTDTNEGGAPGPQEDVSAPSHVDTEDGDSFAGTDYPEGEIESTGDGEVPIEDHRIYDQRNEIRESNVEAWRRLGSSVLQ
jgi:hypothetical protein